MTFADLISAMVIRVLRDQGVKMPKVRRIAKKAAEELGSERPFSVNLATDGTTIFKWVTTKKRRGRGRSAHLIDMDSEQTVIEPVLKPFIRNIDFGPDSAERWWPMGRRAGVVVDPEYSMGRPVTAKHRIPTRILYAARKAGETPERIANWYEIPKAEVLAAVRFEERLSQAA